MRPPTLRILRTRYPDLAGVLMRDWQRQHYLVAYYHDRRNGFCLVAVRPCWRWMVRLVFGCWLGQWGRPASLVRVVWCRQRVWGLRVDNPHQ